MSNRLIPNPQQINDDNVDNSNGINTVQTPNSVQIELEDVEDEIAYWQSFIVFYILGANPPQNVMSGFVHIIWEKFGVDKVSLVGRGVFLVPFRTMENSQKVLQGSSQII